MIDYQKWDAKRQDGASQYDIQSDIIKSALEQDQPDMDAMIKQMRLRCEPVIYFIGSRLDNNHCLGSHDISMAITVLPEDGWKAAAPGYHPGSTEIYVAFQGSLIIESLSNGAVKSEVAGQFNAVILPPGQCHRVRYEPQRQAASIFVKSNPHHEPKVVRCSECAYIRHPEDDCCLYKSWMQQIGVYKGTEWECKDIPKLVRGKYKA